MNKQTHFGNVVIFGGTGFIGRNFAVFLLEQKLTSTVYLVDIKPLEEEHTNTLIKELIDEGRLKIIQWDVRNSSFSSELPNQADLAVNLAAIHREPGHQDYEYFETNLKGAENVCFWADQVGCNRIIFTSSIAPYGPAEEPKDEQSLTVPVTAYGSSKLAAEKIHIAWQHRDIEDRQLVIVRPGVVFGPGEGGNVSRMIKAVLHRYFFYMGNAQTRKAGIYVKELCHAMMWVLQKQEETGEQISLFNMGMNPAPTVEDYVNEICKVAGVKRFVPRVPYPMMLIAAYVIDGMAKLFKINQPISPVRIRKLVCSNYIVPAYLKKHGYPYQYTFHQALEDWKRNQPGEWIISRKKAQEYKKRKEKINGRKKAQKPQKGLNDKK